MGSLISKITSEGLTQLPNSSFSFQFNGVIWKVVYDRFCNQLALEVRDQDELKLSLEVIDLEINEKKELGLSEIDWWSSVLFFQNHHLFVEKYQDAQSPLKKDLLHFDVRKPELINSFTGYQLLNLSSENFTIQEIEQPENIREYSINAPERGAHLFLQPVFYEKGDDEFIPVQEYLTGIDLVLGAEYLEWKNYIIISYYQRFGKEFERKILIIKGNDEILHQTQDQEMKGYAPGAFFICNRYLIFVVEKNRLNAIEI